MASVLAVFVFVNIAITIAVIVGMAWSRPSGRRGGTTVFIDVNLDDCHRHDHDHDHGGGWDFSDDD